MPDRISIVFCGTSPFAVPSLEALLKDDRFDVQLVITQPDRPVGRKQELTPPAVKEYALKHNLKVLQPEKLNKEFSILHSQFSIPDFLIVVSYGQILSDAVLAWPKVMPVNVHASLLPRWRGASPIQQAILAGDKQTGVTVQKMVKELDAGPILAQASTSIKSRETTPTLHDRLAHMGAELLIQTLTKPLKPQEQDPTEITFCRLLTRADGQADTNTHTAEEIDRKVRALTPWPGVTLTMDNQSLKILETSLEPTGEFHPITCRDGSILYLLTVQPAGKKPMTGAEWARGRRA